jgi:hypothetical protein
MESFKDFCRRTEKDMRSANRRKADSLDFKGRVDLKNTPSLLALTQDDLADRS